eukprot:3263656-Rhodomonas_salina.4
MSGGIVPERWLAGSEMPITRPCSVQLIPCLVVAHPISAPGVNKAKPAPDSAKTSLEPDAAWGKCWTLPSVEAPGSMTWYVRTVQGMPGM